MPAGMGRLPEMKGHAQRAATDILATPPAAMGIVGRAGQLPPLYMSGNSHRELAWRLQIPCPTMTEEHRHAISTLFNAEPILLHAADFGWVQRARWYWTYGIYIEKHVTTYTYDMMPNGTALKNVTLLRYTGARQSNHWLPDAGWHWVGRGMPTCKAVAVPGECMDITYTEAE